MIVTRVPGQALVLIALAAQAWLSPDSTQVVIQFLIFGGICVQAAITILTHIWDSQDRARKQKELLMATVAQSDDLKREVVATTQLQLSATNTAAAEVKAAIQSNGDDKPKETP